MLFDGHWLLPNSKKKKAWLSWNQKENSLIQFLWMHSYCKLTTSFSLSLRLLLNMPSDYSFYIWNTLFLSVSLRLALFSTLFLAQFQFVFFLNLSHRYKHWQKAKRIFISLRNSSINLLWILSVFFSQKVCFCSIQCYFLLELFNFFLIYLIIWMQIVFLLFHS